MTNLHGNNLDVWSSDLGLNDRYLTGGNARYRYPGCVILVFIYIISYIDCINLEC